MFIEYPKALYRDGLALTVQDKAEEEVMREAGYTDWHADHKAKEVAAARLIEAENAEVARAQAEADRQAAQAADDAVELAELRIKTADQLGEIQEQRERADRAEKEVARLQAAIEAATKAEPAPAPATTSKKKA